MRTHEDGDEVGRADGRAREDYEELRGLLAEAGELLGTGDSRGSSEALKRAGVKAATMWGGVGVPVLPRPVRDLISLIGETQNLVAHDARPDAAEPLLERLGGIRSAFERAAREESGAAPGPPRFSP